MKSDKKAVVTLGDEIKAEELAKRFEPFLDAVKKIERKTIGVDTAGEEFQKSNPHVINDEYFQQFVGDVSKAEQRRKELKNKKADPRDVEDAFKPRMTAEQRTFTLLSLGCTSFNRGRWSHPLVGKFYFDVYTEELTHLAEIFFQAGAKQNQLAIKNVLGI